MKKWPHSSQPHLFRKEVSLSVGKLLYLLFISEYRQQLVHFDCCLMKMRAFKNKGAALVLVWTLLPFAVCISSSNNIAIDKFIISLMVIFAVSFPIVGCLSDVCLGRYNTIHYSLWMLWLSLIACNGYFTVKEYTELEHKLTLKILECIIGGCTAVSMSGIISSFFF